MLSKIKNAIFATNMVRLSFSNYMEGNDKYPLFLQGNSLDVLKSIPDESVNCVITSPPYWGKRQYENGGIGLEETYSEYIDNLLAIISEVYRVLRKDGAFWLNIGDSYKDKHQLGIPWRIAIHMIDKGWILRNDVIWYKIKGGMNATNDRFASVYEDFFFFVKDSKYYFDDAAIRSKPRDTIVKNGHIVSATGVSGKRYKRQIELSTSLSEAEKKNALEALENVNIKVQKGEITDYRMVIRNQQRATHSDSTLVSGRAKELRDKGFYFLFYNPKGTLPNDVWEILPEDTQKRKEHFAPFPESLCVIPIKSTCPEDGVVLDPFSGTGTTMKVAYALGRKSVGIDLSEDYINLAKNRIEHVLNL